MAAIGSAGVPFALFLLPDWPAFADAHPHTNKDTTMSAIV
jgi:hypothetical protein